LASSRERLDRSAFAVTVPVARFRFAQEGFKQIMPIHNWNQLPNLLDDLLGDSRCALGEGNEVKTVQSLECTHGALQYRQRIADQAAYTLTVGSGEQTKWTGS